MPTPALTVSLQLPPRLTLGHASTLPWPPKPRIGGSGKGGAAALEEDEVGVGLASNGVGFSGRGG